MIKKLMAAVVTAAALLLAFAPVAPASDCGIPQALPGCTDGY
jgi:hypothetical protein